MGMNIKTAGKIKDPMRRQYAIQALKSKFLDKDIRKERAEMGYDSDYAIHDDLCKLFLQLK